MTPTSMPKKCINAPTQKVTAQLIAAVYLAFFSAWLQADTPPKTADQNPGIPRANYSQPKVDCTTHPDLPGCHPHHPHPLPHPPVYLLQTDGGSSDGAQRDASYQYVVSQQKACTQASPDGFASGDLNRYCVAKFKDSILQHCANFQPDANTSAICKMALELDSAQKK
ncbi:MAG TPA: hypothetical protein VFM46_08445 [Pseudomonadales bacterium]|nr:hypothetical protein [Pseudomonadales bacterium]